MSAYEYLTVNSLTTYPFRDGRAVNSIQPIDADVFLDILFVVYDPTIKRPYIKQIKSEDGGVSIDFHDVDGDLKIFTVEIPSAEFVSHYKNFDKSFFGYIPNEYRPKAAVKLVFGQGISKIADVQSTVVYTPDETELSPSAVQYSVPEVSTLEFESWFPDFDSKNYNPSAGQDIISVKTYLREEEVKMRYGFNNVFNYLAPRTMFLDVARGAGLGLYDPCDNIPPHDLITRINQVEPDPSGNIYFKVSDCHSLRLLTDDERNSALERILADGTDYVNFNVKHYLKFWDQLPYQNYNETISPNGKNVNILGDGQNGTINSINHGFVLENHCKPKCPHENLNAFAEYLNRVKDGVSELFKVVENPIETCGYATINGAILTATSFCDQNIINSNWLEAPLCNQGFKKYFHEGRKIKIRYNNATFYNPEIVEVIEGQNGLNTQIVLNQELPDFLPGEQYLFKVLDFGLVNKLNFEIIKHNNALITTNSPYIEFNYGTVEAFNNDDEYVTFITTVTVVYNPSEEEITVDFTSAVNDITTLIDTSVKVKYPDGEIRYEETEAVVPCKGYAIWEAIFYVPCSPELPAPPNEGHVIISVVNRSTGEILENAPKEVKLNSANCVNIDIKTIRTSAKENDLFKFNIVKALNLSDVANISFAGNIPAWLNRDTSSTGAVIPGIEDNEGYHLWGTPTANNQGILNEEFSIDITITASGVFRTTLFLSYIAKPRIISHTNGQIIEINPPDTFTRTYTQGSPLIRINATNTPIDYRFESAIPGFGQAGANSNKFIGRYGYNPTFVFPITYPVRLFAINSASSEEDELYVDIFVKVYNVGQTASTAFQDIAYCFTIPNPDSAALTLISTLPLWLNFDRNAAECNLSGLNSSNISVIERVVIRYDYANGFENREYSIGYRARPVITYPPEQVGNNIFTLELRPPDYTVSGLSKVYNEQNPLISVKILDASSTGLVYSAEGLPTGLEINESGKIIGQIDESVIPGDYLITLRVADPAFSGTLGIAVRQIKLILIADEKLFIARENSNFCLKFTELASASSYTVKDWLDGKPTWLTEANRVGAACHLTNSDNLKPSGDLSKDYRFTLAYITATNPPIQLEVNYLLRYIAKPRILYPQNGEVFQIASEDLSEVVFTEENPLLSFEVVNDPTNYEITGLPSGLSLVNGKIVGAATNANPVGDYNVTLYASNTAGVSSISIKISIKNITIQRAFQLDAFCYKITGISNALYYSLEGDKPNWLTFNPASNAVCPVGNLYGTPPISANQSASYDLILVAHRGSGELRQSFKLEYYARPNITYPLPDTVFTISPPDYNNLLFTSTNPLFKIEADNNPTSYRVNGFPERTFRVDGNGNIIGSSGATITDTQIPVQLYARNEAGESTPVRIFIVITNQINTITFNYTAATPCATGAKYKFELEDQPESITLVGHPTWITFNPSLTTDCNLTFGNNRPVLTTSQTIPLTLTRNYRGGNTKETFNLLITTIPIITNPINTTLPTNRIRYVISQPDFNNRIYSVQSPLLTITATNSPTNITASGLPSSLSVVTSGPDIGKVISVNQSIPVSELGLFIVTATASNGAGSSMTVVFEIEAKNEIIEISTRQGEAINNEFCKLITRDRATSYSIVAGTLLNGLNFSGSTDAGCNFFGVPSGGNDELSILDVRSNYVGGFSTFRIRFSHINKPSIVRFTRNGNTIIDDALSVLPGVYVGTTFTEELPLFSIDTTGNPTSFYAEGFPQNSTLSISCNGKVIGTINQAAAGKYTVIITAVNEAGESEKRTIYLDFSQAVPVITWENPDDITHPTPLNSIDHLNATANVPGSFAYLPPAGNILSASTQPRVLTVTFTPTDQITYATVAKSVTIRVFKATPTITWNTPSAISYYTALTAAQLNATANIAGTFVYSPGLGHIFNAGTHSITVTFTPVDTTNYNSATRQTELVVNKITVTPSNIYWSTPSSIVYGVALSGTQLNALARISSTDATSPAIPSNSSSYVYSPVLGTVLAVGTHNLTVTFVSSDSTNFTVTPVQKVVTISVVAQAPPITWNTPAAITYGTLLSSTQLNATSTIAGLTYTYTPTFGALLNAGTRTLSLTVSGNPNYASTTVTREILVNKAASSITFTSPTSGRVGDHILLTTEKTGSTSPVVYSSASTAIINIINVNRANLLTAGTASVTAQVEEDANFLAAARSQNITITRGLSTVTITSTNSTKVGNTFTLAATATGSTGQISFSSSNANLLSITGGSIATALGSGQVTLTASVAATANYDSGSSTQTITIAKGDSNIASINMVNLFQGETSTITTQRTGSTGAITYTSSNPAVISISGNIATFNSGGTANITATLAEDNNYLGTTRTQSFTVTPKSTVTITWSGVTTLTLGQTVQVIPFSTTAPALADSLITATTADSTIIRVITVGGIVGPVLEAIKPGTTQITLRVPGTIDRQEATLIVAMTVQKISSTLTINNLINNNLTVPLSSTSYFIGYSISPTSHVYGGTAPAFDNLTSSVTSVATRDPNSSFGHVNLLSVGTTTITFNRPTNTFWEAVSRSFTLTVTKGSSTLNITGPTSAKVGQSGTITFTKTGSTATPVFTAASGTGLIITGNAVSYTKAGSQTLTGTLAGDTNYDGITSTRTLNVSKGDTSLSFEYFVNSVWTATKPTSVLPGQSLRIRRVVSGSTGTVTLTATPSENLGATSECVGSNSGVCEAVIVFNNTSLGVQTITLSVATDTNYNAATVTTNITIQKGSSTLTVGTPNSLTYGTPVALSNIQLTRTGTTGAPVFSTNDSNIQFTQQGLTFSSVNTLSNPAPNPGSGTYSVTLAADDQYNSITASKTVTLLKGTPTFTFEYSAVISGGASFTCATPMTNVKPNIQAGARSVLVRINPNMQPNQFATFSFSATGGTAQPIPLACNFYNFLYTSPQTTGQVTVTINYSGDGNTNATSTTITFNIV
jgi:hypothetical protein